MNDLASIVNNYGDRIWHILEYQKVCTWYGLGPMSLRYFFHNFSFDSREFCTSIEGTHLKGYFVFSKAVFYKLKILQKY